MSTAPAAPGGSAAARARQARLEELLTPVVATAGLDLEALEVTAAGRRSVVRVSVDVDGGVTLDHVADVSRAVSEALDALEQSEPEVLAGAYVLEVGSPGVDRPLTAERHWRRNTGRLVAVTPREGEAFTGRVLEAGAEAAVLDVDGERREASYSSVVKAVVQVEFTRAADDEEGDA